MLVLRDAWSNVLKRMLVQVDTEEGRDRITTNHIVNTSSGSVVSHTAGAATAT